MVNVDRARRWLDATIVVQPALAGSQIPQPHLEDGSVYRQNRPPTTDDPWNFGTGSNYPLLFYVSGPQSTGE